MALSDPQSITIGANTISLPRTSSGDNTGSFTSADKNDKVDVAHQYNRRNRQSIRLTHRKVAADPLVAAQNLNYSLSVVISIDTPPVGFTPTEILDCLKAMVNNLSASTYANGVKFVGGES